MVECLSDSVVQTGRISPSSSTSSTDHVCVCVCEGLLSVYRGSCRRGSVNVLLRPVRATFPDPSISYDTFTSCKLDVSIKPPYYCRTRTRPVKRSGRHRFNTPLHVGGFRRVRPRRPKLCVCVCVCGVSLLVSSENVRGREPP